MTNVVLPGISILEEAVSAGSWRARVEVESTTSLVAGHFPDEPVVPGITHLGIALEGASRLAGRRLRLASVGTLALLRVVRPGDLLDVSVSTDDTASLRFDVRCRGQVAARGVMQTA